MSGDDFGKSIMIDNAISQQEAILMWRKKPFDAAKATELMGGGLESDLSNRSHLFIYYPSSSVTLKIRRKTNKVEKVFQGQR